MGARLAALNMSQQPVVVAPLAHQGELGETLLNYGAVAGTSTPASDGSDFGSFLQALGIGT